MIDVEMIADQSKSPEGTRAKYRQNSYLQQFSVLNWRRAGPHKRHLATMARVIAELLIKKYGMRRKGILRDSLAIRAGEPPKWAIGSARRPADGFGELFDVLTRLPSVSHKPTPFAPASSYKLLIIRHKILFQADNLAISDVYQHI